MSVDELVDQWLAVDINPNTRNEIESLHKAGKGDELRSRLGKRIAFGTAGLRSSMTAGFAHMNDVTVLQASQGLISYLQEKRHNEGDEVSIVVGYDHRHNSQRFAELLASAALLRGVKVYYLGLLGLSSTSISLSSSKFQATLSPAGSGLVHTPLVPFSIDHFGASAGVMITASHNPAQDNGYKVYYGNGCQIIPPHDAGIADSINQNFTPWTGVWDVAKNFEVGISSGKLVSIHKQATEAYLEKVEGLFKVKGGETHIEKFVYTPIHGVGGEIFTKAFSKLLTSGEFVIVKEQASPDPDFPTVAFPNPEEKGALDLAIATAEREGVNLVVANDPDADRFSVAVRDRKTGKWQQLTGNEIGFLFAMWTIENADRTKLKDLYLVNSTVSSQVLKSMADIEGFHFQDTLTGFKWIGNKAIDLKLGGYIVPFGFEEAIGYMFDVVNDKDGVAAAMVWLQLYQVWSNPIDKLVEGYNKYGWFKECNGYYKLDDLSKTDKIFNETIRESYSSYPKSIGTEFEVTYWRDLTIGFETGTPNNIPILPSDPKSQMITGVVKPTESLDDKEYVRFTCRGSGTEPKLKVYIEARAGNEERSIQLANLCWEVLKREWFRPKENGIIEVK